ncbi:hypothetical protein C8R43DRAFT_887345, partial [Mycena crocata]
RIESTVVDLHSRIAATPQFPCVRRFKHGRRFKQWTGDDSKALMKVIRIEIVISAHSSKMFQIYLPTVQEFIPHINIGNSAPSSALT